MREPDVWQLLNQLPHPDQPFVTVVSDTGRVELSGRTLVNGIAKAANAFRDVLDTEPGDSVAIELGWTWQQSVWQGAALVAGLHLVGATDASLTETEPLIIDPSLISIHPMGLPAGGDREITADVLGQPDVWLYPEYHHEHAVLMDHVRVWSHDVGVHVNDRVGIIVSPNLPPQAHLFGPLLMPLIMTGSVVFLNDCQPEHIESLISQEKINFLLSQ